MDPHIKVTASKVAKHIGIIRDIAYLLPKKTLGGLYHTMVNAYFNYGNCRGHDDINPTLLGPLLHLVAEPLAVIFNSCFNTTCTYLNLLLSYPYMYVNKA